jgi:hypothetical protein
MQVVRNAVLLVFAVVLASGCASTPVTKNAEIPAGTEIVVVPFRDCLISGQDEDCTGSGVKTGEAFRDAFSEGGKFKARLVDRPVGAKETWSDKDVAEWARRNNYDYVLTGEVDDFYSVAAMTFRPDRAAASARIIRASDGLVVAAYSKPGSAGSNFATPKGMMKGIATEMRNGL